jgi:hypothetical protein
VSLVIGSGLRIAAGVGSGATKTLVDLQTFLAASNPGQVVKVTDRAESPYSYTWAYSDGVTWKSVYKRDLVSTDPGSISEIKVGSLWNPMFMDVDTNFQELYGYVTSTVHVMGDEPATHLIPNFINCFLNRDRTDGLLTNTGNSQPVQKLALHIDGAPKAALVYWNGSRAYTIADGAADINADEVPASAFGLDEIPGGSRVQAKLYILHAGPASVPYSNRNPAEGFNTNMLRFTPGDGTNGTTAMSDTDLPGAFTWTGTEPVQRSGGYYPFILARHKSRKAVALIVEGTSITAAVRDAADVLGGPAWFQRGIKMFTVKPGAFNFAVSGSHVYAGINDPRWSAYYKYCTGAMIEYPTNDIPAMTAAQLKTAVDRRRDRMVDNGIPLNKIAAALPIAYTTGDYTTEAGQSPQPGWGIGEVAQQFKGLMRADSSYGLKLEGAELIGANGVVFKANKASDNLHPDRPGHIEKAAAAAPLMEPFYKIA